MLVFAFDRDWTVDVNPHPNREAVPLEWVRQLAHETEHAVYAIGNQILTDEAAIPGVVDIVGRHPDEWDDWLGEKQPDGYYERFPTRRERLALIADLHSDADGYIVVDDIDLSDVDGWKHYHAWEFVPAVERCEVALDLQGVRDPTPDGGLPVAAGIIPTDASHLSSFLDEYGDAPSFELTYTVDDEESTTLLWNVSQDAVRIEEPAESPGIMCTPLAPGRDQFIIGLDAIEKLSVVEPPPETFAADAETPTENAIALRRLAETKPAAVRVSSVLTLLDQEDPARLQQRNTLQALRAVATRRPEDCTPALPIHRSLLTEDDLVSPCDALAVLRAIGDYDAAEIAPATDEISPYLESNIVPARREAAACVAAIAAEFPEDAIDAVPELVTSIDTNADGQQSAVFALERIAREFPEAVTPAAEALGDVIVDESVPDDTRMGATATLGRAVSDSPSLAIDIIDDVARLYEADDHKLRNNAIALTFEVAAIHTDVVEPYVDEIAALLTVEDTYTRTNASGALARVAEDFPVSVEHKIPTLVKLLTDDDARVRENACWALGYLRASEAETPLEDRTREDPEQDVRTRAAWALSQIEAA